MTMKEWMKHVRDYAGEGGWIVYHTDSSRWTDGRPALILLRDRKIIFIGVQDVQDTVDWWTVEAKMEFVPDTYLGENHDWRVWYATWRSTDWPEVKEMLW